jgi:hypothetical protein
MKQVPQSSVVKAAESGQLLGRNSIFLLVRDKSLRTQERPQLLKYTERYCAQNFHVFCY